MIISSRKQRTEHNIKGSPPVFAPYFGGLLFAKHTDSIESLDNEKNSAIPWGYHE
jgi:hypothetical protein